MSCDARDTIHFVLHSALAHWALVQVGFQVGDGRDPWCSKYCSGRIGHNQRQQPPSVSIT